MSYEGPSTTATNSAGDARPLMVPTIQQVSTTTPAPQSTFQSSELVASFSGCKLVNTHTFVFFPCLISQNLNHHF